MINKKPYKIYGRARIINGEYVDLWFKTYNKQQAINFIKNHSEYYDILNLRTYIHIVMYDGICGYKECEN